MAYFSVSYQLNKKKNYPKLWEEMERLGAHKAMNDYYLLDVGCDTAAELRDHLDDLVDDDDMLFVVRLDSRPAPYRCYQGTKAWLDARF
jgi:hypothetical protein